MPQDYEKISLGDTLELSGVIAGIENGAVTLTNKTTGCVIPLRCDISARQAQIIRAGGLLNYTREKTSVNTGISAPRRLSRHVRRQKINDNGGTQIWKTSTAAKEKFGALIEAQKKRVAAMRAQGDFVDYAALPQIVIGVCGGDGIGPIITHEAERVLRFLLKDEVESGQGGVQGDRRPDHREPRRAHARPSPTTCWPN